MLRRSQGKFESQAALIPSNSIAVLPFENLSRRPDNAYFADGIQDEILTRLIQDCRFEGDLAHFNAALPERAEKPARDRQAAWEWRTFWKAAFKRVAIPCA